MKPEKNKGRDSADSPNRKKGSKSKTAQMTKLEQQQQILNERHHNYLENHKGTIVNFQENVNMLAAQSEYLTSLMEEINQG